MNIITTRTDLVNYLSDVRADVRAFPRGEEYIDAMADQIQASDHPAWGEDWSAWLGEWVDGVITETVDRLDAIGEEEAAFPIACKGADNGCSCGAPGCLSYANEDAGEEDDLHTQTLALVASSGIVDGTGTLYTVCEQAIVDGEGTPERVREIWAEATESWQQVVENECHGLDYALENGVSVDALSEHAAGVLEQAWGRPAVSDTGSTWYPPHVVRRETR